MMLWASSSWQRNLSFGHRVLDLKTAKGLCLFIGTAALSPLISHLDFFRLRVLAETLVGWPSILLLGMSCSINHPVALCRSATVGCCTDIAAY